MTFNEYLQNPSGKGATAMNSRIIREGLEKRYEVVEKKGITHTIYEAGKGNYLFHVLVPSESERENTYDVCFHVIGGGGVTVRDWEFLLFSNCPSFVFTFAYAYHKQGEIIPFLSKKYPREVTRRQPVERNPHQILNYEKSVFFAMHYLIENNYVSLNYIRTHLSRFNQAIFTHGIRHSDAILLEIKKEQNRLDKEKKAKEEEKKSQERNLARRALRAAKSGIQTITGKKPVEKIRGRKKIGGR